MTTGRQANEFATDAPGPVVPAENAEDLYEHAPCGYLSTLPDGTIIRVNDTLLSWTGHRRDALVGQRHHRVVDLILGEDRGALFDLVFLTHARPHVGVDGVRAGSGFLRVVEVLDLGAALRGRGS